MYNQVLDTFIAVAREGSFSKAASSLFISPVSVMKQINHFEAELGFKVFERTPRGVTLTPAGRSLLAASQQIIDESRTAVTKAKSLSKQPQTTTIRIATSLLRSAQPIMEAWEQISSENPQYTIQVMPFNDDASSLRRVTNQLGKTVDLSVGPTNANYLMNNDISFFNLGDRQCNVMVPKKNQLARKQRLTWTDLDGQALLLLRPHLSPKIDELREEIKSQHHRIQIINTDHFYNMAAFNLAANHNYLMETLDIWNDIHPSMVSLPIDWDYSISYGILYSSSADERVKEFISMVGQQYLKVNQK